MLFMIKKTSDELWKKKKILKIFAWAVWRIKKKKVPANVAAMMKIKARPEITPFILNREQF